MNWKIVNVVVLALLATLAVGFFVWALTQTELLSTGNIVTEGVEVRDLDGVTVVASMEWGNCISGASYTKDYKLYNVGDVDLTVSMTHTFDAALGTFTWDSEGLLVTVGNYIPITFTLTIDPTATATDFSFTITIIGA